MVEGLLKAVRPVAANEADLRAVRPSRILVTQWADAKGEPRLRTGAGPHAASICRWTRGGSRMREGCKYGSVRGARGNPRPYRDVCLLRCMSLDLADFVAKVWDERHRAPSARRSMTLILPLARGSGGFDA